MKKLKAELKELEEGKTAEEDGETKEKLTELYQLASSYYSIKDMLVQCCHFSRHVIDFLSREWSPFDYVSSPWQNF